MNDPFFLTLPEAAALLRVKVTTVYDWVHQRKVPFRKHGSRVIFRRDELLAWSESRAVTPVIHGRVDAKLFDNPATHRRGRI
jgi:excisionase family DNA binding protein